MDENIENFKEIPVMDVDFFEEKTVNESEVKCNFVLQQTKYSICNIAQEFADIIDN